MHVAAAAAASISLLCITQCHVISSQSVNYDSRSACMCRERCTTFTVHSCSQYLQRFIIIIIITTSSSLSASSCNSHDLILAFCILNSLCLRLQSLSNNLQSQTLTTQQHFSTLRLSNNAQNTSKAKPEAQQNIYWYCTEWCHRGTKGSPASN